jgi:hypothetical protein
MAQECITRHIDRHQLWVTEVAELSERETLEQLIIKLESDYNQGGDHDEADKP